ncbi:AAA family ATPase [Acetobacterium malicum]|uniref:AAA family ATPase n=1 Tax=Acetobacterium malicum TaxID=52692 RepID=UPI0035948B22
MSVEFQWVPFYQALADKLLTYSDKRSEFSELIKKVASVQPLMKYLHFEREDWWGPRNHQIDPFSVIGVMNRGTTDANRNVLAKVLSETFEIHIQAPTHFAGIPVMNNMRSFFVGPDEIWQLFILALKVSETNTFSDEFKRAFEQAIALKGNGLAYISMGLFWIRPNVFMPLDANSRAFVSAHYGLTAPSGSCTGNEYVKFLETLKIELSKQNSELSFPELSHKAWIERGAGKPSDPKVPTASGNIVSQSVVDIPEVRSTKFAKNIIICGTPGTGKTYSTVQYAVAIVEETTLNNVKAEDYNEVFARYLKYKEDGIVAFTTFHQSFGYEEFIEGIRPVVSTEDKSETGREIEYEIHDGIFKEFCDKARIPIGSGASDDLGIGKNPTVWKVSLEGTGDNPTRTECFANNHIRIGYDSYGETLPDSYEKGDNGRNILSAFYYKMQIGDIVMSCYSNKTIDAIGLITGEPEWHDEYPQYKRLRSVKWFVTGINVDIYDFNSEKLMMQPSVYKLSVSVSDALQILKKAKPSLFTQNVKILNRVFIIDEINRGNISKIFGELITLLEPSKRIGAKEQLRAMLPYSGQHFGVPDNVYLIGTMNTADRSTALIDTALRRRFSFVEIQPGSSTLTDVLVDGIDISQMLDTLNKRIIVLLDREHTIGHSYLLSLKTDPTIENLAAIFQYTIVPLLQEYFYDDYEKIQLVLGDNQKPDDSTRFVIKKTDAMMLFGNADIDFPEYYEINNAAFKRIDAYAFF